MPVFRSRSSTLHLSETIRTRPQRTGLGQDQPASFLVPGSAGHHVDEAGRIVMMTVRMEVATAGT